MINDNQAPVSKLTGVPGWETPVEQELLRRYAQKVPAKGVILEIGSEYGMSASIFRKFSQDTVQICCVDINAKAPYMANLKEAKLAWNVHEYPMDSQKFWGWWEDLKADSTGFHGSLFDLIFVDGDHSYNGALADLKGAGRFVKLNGYIIIHDTACNTNHDPHPLHYEVSRAVNEWWNQKVFDLVETNDSIMVFRKKPDNA